MLPLKEKDKPVVQKLLSSGCCARCVLRFCCVLVQSLYRQPGEDESEEGTRTATEQSDDPPKKRMKLDDGLKGSEASAGSGDAEAPPAPALSHCVVCLGVLQEYCSRDHARKVAEAVKTEDYHFETILLSVSLPAQLCVREHSCWLHVKKEMREKVMTRVKDDIVPLKEAFKWSVQGLIATELGGVYLGDEPCSLQLFDFVSILWHYVCSCSDVFLLVHNVEIVSYCPPHGFRHYPTPPGRPTSICTSQAIQCLHTSIYVAGRYNKYSRSLSQTPWIIDGRRMMESSVEELIAEPLASSFRSKGFNFSSSGREDVDVRTLGKGRPFAMEMLNPHRYRFTKMEMKKIQETINTSSDKIAVRDLQIVTRECMGHMKEGEEEKTKSYTALVWTQKPIEKDDIIFLDDIKELTLDQKTPLRVLHRRALAVRQRVIHSMNASFRDPHHFYLRLKTQAGTYIKEFVHGDFGRTKPNLCQLLKMDTDILELDVEVGNCGTSYFQKGNPGKSTGSMTRIVQLGLDFSGDFPRLDVENVIFFFSFQKTRLKQYT
uniref:tRNA pseudouridine(55) synthase n=1 Tax=Gadus morhua TaxID=8049 RepID=A0A8C4Z1T1_GADMO